MKFLYVGDLHQDELEPVSRIDDFNETRKEKISEIMSIAKTNHVKAILHGGDFFNRPKMSNEFVTSVMEMWNEKLIPIDIQELTFQFQTGSISEEEYLDALHQYKIGNIPFISIIGNHDLIGESMDSYPKTSLNVLETSGFLHIVDKDNPIIFQDSNVSVAVTGYSYNRELDKSSDKEGYCVKRAEVDGKPVDYHIHMAHGMLTDHSYGQKFAHTTIAEISQKTEADLTIDGHDHIGFPLTERDGKLFVNPGSPFRLSADTKEIARMPKVMLINIDKNGIKIEDIYLKCAKDGKMVLSTNGKKNKQSKQAIMAKIQTLINQSSMKKGLRIADIIENIGSAENIDEEILKDVQNKIINHMAILQPDFSPSGEYYITRLELDNFLSHQKSAFDFENGLNILAGESRAGKSAVLRALREVLTCYLTQPRKAIFFGASYFTITVYTSNGYIITRRVERDEKKGFNGYIIYDPNTGQTSKYNTKSVTLVQEILGYKRIPLTDKKQIDINSVIQGDGWFFLGNNITAPDRARLLGVVYGTHYADSANKEIASDIKKQNTQLALMKKEKERLENTKKSYSYLPNLQKDLNDSDLLLAKLEAEEKRIADMKAIYSKMQAIENEKKNLEKVLKALSEDLKPYLQALKEQKKNLNLMKQTFQWMTDVVNQGKVLRPIAKALVGISKCNQDITELKNKQEKLKKVKEEYEKCCQIQKKIEENQKEQKNLNHMNQTLSVIPELKKEFSVMQQKQKDLEKYRENTKKVLEYNTTIKKIEKEMESYKICIPKFQNIPSMEELKAMQKLKELIEKAKTVSKQLEDTKKEGTEQREQWKEIKDKNLKNIAVYKTMLESMGECPVCHNDIDNGIVEKLVNSHLEKVNQL